MSKKGLISSLIVGIVLTLSLGIYTLVSVFGGSNPGAPAGPTNTTINVAFRTNDIVKDLDGYQAEDLEFTLPEGVTESPVKLNEETGKYEAVSAGEVKIVISLDDKGNTKTLNVKVYNQGAGTSVEDAYIIASPEHLKEFAVIVNTISAERVVPAYTKLVSDIDLGEYNWKPIGGQGNAEYTGTFDGNGYTINNLTISVNETNYQDFLALSTTTEARAFLDLGLFGKVNNATIKNLNVKNSTINVAESIYNIVVENIRPEGATYDKIARLTIGTIAGSAYNTDIIGAEAHSLISSRVNAFSCGVGQSHGIGGVVGVAQLVRVSDYDVKVNITNNLEAIKGSYVGGVFGMAFSTYNIGYTDNVYEAQDKTVVDDVKVDFASTLIYNNRASVGGMVGYGRNIAIQHSTVESFKVVDNTAKSHINYKLEQSEYTAVGGVAVDFVSVPLSGEEKNTPEVVEAFVASMEDVHVKNIDVFMLGGDIAGAVWYVGSYYDETANADVTESVVIKDSTVEGHIVANRVGGFAWQVNPGATIKYTKEHETAVVDLDIKAVVTSGFVMINHGKISGYYAEVPVSEGSEETKEVMTKIDVNITGMGALVEQPTNANVWLARNSVFASGFAGKMETLVSPTNPNYQSYLAWIENFDINVKANNSINYAGIAFKTSYCTIYNMKVNADFTSYNYSAQGNNISTTYMVAGAVSEASYATVLNDVEVIINVNKNIDKSLNYGATYFGGLVARFLGSEKLATNEDAGIAIIGCQVSGDVYFNHSSEIITIDSVNYNAFVAGGLIGSVSAKTLAGGQENVDAFGMTSFKGSIVSENTVSNLKITADITNEMLGNQGYRARGIGALMGVVNIHYNEDVIDLSNNTITGVEIVADETSFKYSYDNGSGGSVVNILLGANKANAYGASYAWNCSIADKITNPAEMDITYTALAE